MTEEIRRPVNVSVTKENIASSALYIFTSLSGTLRSLEDNVELVFKRVLRLDLIAWASKVKVSDTKRLKRFTYNDKKEHTTMALQSNISLHTGTKRKVANADGTFTTGEEDRSSLFIPRDFEVHHLRYIPIYSQTTFHRTRARSSQ